MNMIRTLLVTTFFTLVGQNLSYGSVQATQFTQYGEQHVDSSKMKVIQTHLIDQLWEVELLEYDAGKLNNYFMIRVTPYVNPLYPTTRYTNDCNQIHFSFHDGLGKITENKFQRFDVNKYLYFGESFSKLYLGRYIQKTPLVGFKGIRINVRDLKISCDLAPTFQSLTSTQR